MRVPLPQFIKAGWGTMDARRQLRPTTWGESSSLALLSLLPACYHRARNQECNLLGILGAVNREYFPGC